MRERAADSLIAPPDGAASCRECNLSTTRQLSGSALNAPVARIPRDAPAGGRWTHRIANGPSHVHVPQSASFVARVRGSGAKSYRGLHKSSGRGRLQHFVGSDGRARTRGDREYTEWASRYHQVLPSGWAQACALAEFNRLRPGTFVAGAKRNVRRRWRLTRRAPITTARRYVVDTRLSADATSYHPPSASPLQGFTRIQLRKREHGAGDWRK